MIRRRSRQLAVILVTCVVASGCGEPERVTYVDPNPAAAYPTGDSTGTAEPATRFGADAVARAGVFAQLRGSLDAYEATIDRHPADARRILARAQTELVPRVSGPLHLADPATARSLPAALAAIATAPDDPAQVARIRAARSSIDRASASVLATDARQDVGFRAQVVYEALSDAALRLEQISLDELSTADARDEHLAAYGSIVDVATRGVPSVFPDSQQARLRARVETLLGSTFPDPAVPSDSATLSGAVTELQELADLVTVNAGIEPSFPPPGRSTPEALREVKRAVARSVGRWEAGDADSALAMLTSAARTSLTSAAPGVASMDPTLALLARIERGILLDLPTAMRANGDVSAAAAQLDEDLDDAITQIEDELEQLRAADTDA